MLGAHVDGILRHAGVGRELDRQRLAGIRIGLVKRSAGAGDGDADLVAAVENLAHPADVEGDHIGVESGSGDRPEPHRFVSYNPVEDEAMERLNGPRSKRDILGAQKLLELREAGDLEALHVLLVLIPDERRAAVMEALGIETPAERRRRLARERKRRSPARRHCGRACRSPFRRSPSTASALRA